MSTTFKFRLFMMPYIVDKQEIGSGMVAGKYVLTDLRTKFYQFCETIWSVFQ
jgi:hypothetical protein